MAVVGDYEPSASKSLRCTNEGSRVGLIHVEEELSSLLPHFPTAWNMNISVVINLYTQDDAYVIFFL